MLLLSSLTLAAVITHYHLICVPMCVPLRAAIEGSEMARQRSGSTFKRGSGKNATWWARLTFIDEVTGKRRDLQRRAESKAHAEEIRAQLVRDYDTGGQRLLEAEKKTFDELAAYCKEHFFFPAQYDAEGRKIAGVRGVASALSAIAPLVEYFGKMRIRDITPAHLMAYRAARLQGKTKRGATRTIATVNRELSKMRMMLNIAVQNDWLVKSPFAKARQGSLISTADERQRERILTPDEERRLLAACNMETRKHLHALVIAALDTGARQGELLNLRWSDVDLEARTLRVTSYKGKTVQRRELHITTRLLLELEKLRTKKPPAAWRQLRKTKQRPDEDLVFGISDNVQWAWEAARSEAGLEGLRFHDLRHTAATRLAAHMEAAEVGRVLGHSNPTTTYRYVNRTPEMIKRAGAVLESFGAEAAAQEVHDTAELVN